jgi:hypothetical protein
MLIRRLQFLRRRKSSLIDVPATMRGTSAPTWRPIWLAECRHLFYCSLWEQPTG